MRQIISIIITVLILQNSSVTASENKVFKPAHVIITAGQSNTDGRVNNKLLPDYIKALATDTSGFLTGNYRHCKIVQNSQSGVFRPYWPKGRITEGMWTYDAVTYFNIEQALQQDFYVVKYAVGGTSIQFPNDTANGRYWSADADWLSRTTSFEKGGRSLLLSLTESIDAAIDNTLSKLEQGYQFDAFLWHQGESDDLYAGNYYKNLKVVIAYVRSHLSQKTGRDYSTLPFIFGSISHTNRHYKPEVETAMKRISDQDPHVFLIDMSKTSLQKDRTHFDAAAAEYLGNQMYKILEKKLDLSGVKFRVAKYRNDKACALSYTFDDGLLEHATRVAPALEKLGYRGTFWVNGATIDKNDPDKPRVSWEQLKEMSNKGHEISNHGWSHKNLKRISLEEVKQEICRNDSAILKHTRRLPKTFCYPYNVKNDTIIALASLNRVGTRTHQFSMGGKSTTQNLEQKMAELIQNREWGVAMLHGISVGYDHFKNDSIFYNHLKKTKQLDDKIWVATFAEVAAYVRSEKELMYKVVKNENGFSIIPETPLEKSLFNLPLTALIEVSATDKVKIMQNKKRLKTFHNGTAAMFNFSPYSGPVQVFISKKISK